MKLCVLNFFRGKVNKISKLAACKRSWKTWGIIIDWRKKVASIKHALNQVALVILAARFTNKSFDFGIDKKECLHFMRAWSIFVLHYKYLTYFNNEYNQCFRGEGAYFLENLPTWSKWNSSLCNKQVFSL